MGSVLGGIFFGKYIWRRLVSAVIFLICIFFILIEIFCLNIGGISAESSKKVTAAKKIRAGFYRFEESIDLCEESLIPDELCDIFSSVIKDDPYLFFVLPSMSYTYDKEGKVLSLIPEYSMSRKEAFAAIEYCDKRITEICSLVNNGASELEKIIFLHDHICKNFEYDNTLKNDGIYEFFLYGKGTCKAYSNLYIAILRRCGIEATYAAGDGIEHIWTLVNLGGEWYHSDVTWDDGISSDPGKISRKHLLCSDKKAVSQGHIGWVSAEKIMCGSLFFDNFDFDAFIQGNKNIIQFKYWSLRNNPLPLISRDFGTKKIFFLSNKLLQSMRFCDIIPLN